MVSSDREGLDISIYIDDSGQLHSNYTDRYFVYGGYWCLTADAVPIANTYGLIMNKIYRTKREIKSSDMHDKHKRKVLRKLLRNHDGKLHPVYIATDVHSLTIDFANKSAVQLHKNYILRRLVEDVINEISKQGCSINNINVFIDNQSQTSVENRDNLENYIKKYFRNSGAYLLNSFTTTNADISVSFLESHSSRNIQAADLFANMKFCRFNRFCIDCKIVFSEFLIDPLCRKHPQYFTV